MGRPINKYRVYKNGIRRPIILTAEEIEELTGIDGRNLSKYDDILGMRYRKRFNFISVENDLTDDEYESAFVSADLPLYFVFYKKKDKEYAYGENFKIMRIRAHSADECLKRFSKLFGKHHIVLDILNKRDFQNIQKKRAYA